MIEELEKIIAYISSLGGGLKLEALAVKVHTLGQVSVLVPQRFGQLNQPPGAGSGIRSHKLTVEDVLASPPDEETRDLVRLAVIRWKEMGHEIAPGTRGLSCKALIGQKVQPFFWVIPEGGLWSIEPLFSSFSRRGAPAAPVANYRKAVSEINGFRRERCLTGDRPPAPFAQLSRESVQAFLVLTNELVTEWRKAEEVG